MGCGGGKGAPNTMGVVGVTASWVIRDDPEEPQAPFLPQEESFVEWLLDNQQELRGGK